MHVTVLIPTYNEKENLERLVPLLYTKIYPRAKTIQFSTLIVDDNSRDGTRAIVEKFIRTYPHLFVSYGDKYGIGAAMKRGYTYAMKNLSPDAIVTYEADFVFPPETILTLIDRLSGADVVLASRENASEFYSSSQSRALGHFVANTVIPEWIGGMKSVHEHTAAGRAITVKGVLDQIDLSKLPNGYAFFPASLYAAAQQTQQIVEVTVQFEERSVGSSKLKIGAVFGELMRSLFFALKYRFHGRIG